MKSIIRSTCLRQIKPLLLRPRSYHRLHRPLRSQQISLLQVNSLTRKIYPPTMFQRTFIYHTQRQRPKKPSFLANLYAIGCITGLIMLGDILGLDMPKSGQDCSICQTPGNNGQGQCECEDSGYVCIKPTTFYDPPELG